MKIEFESFDAKGLLQGVIHMAANQAPGGAGKIINHIVDTVFFPSEKVDKDEALWEKMQKNVSKMVSSKVDDAVQNLIGGLAANSLIKKLQNFGNLFRQLVYIKNIDEKKFHLGLLTIEANNLVADINNIPPMYMLKVAKLLQVLASVHISTLMELKALEPNSYKHQSSLNKMSILYSDTAGSMFHSSMAWRRSMIAEGKGVFHQRDTKVETELLKQDKKKVTFTAYDKYGNHRWQPGLGTVAVMKETPEIPVEGGKAEYFDTERAAQKALSLYDEKVQLEWTEIWNNNLLLVTQSFMNLVDWDGVKREKDGKIPRTPNQLIFPINIIDKNFAADSVDRIEVFLEQQMDQFTISGPRYVQTYRTPEPGFPGDHNLIYLRADTYDTAMACIFFLVKNNMQRAIDLGNALVQALNHDPKGGGRIVAATQANNLIDASLNYTTSIYIPEGGRRDIGNMSWAGIALTRLYEKTKKYSYLNAAETIGNWIIENCSVNDGWGGFNGGEDHWGTHQKWRSVEHNVDCVSFFDNLYVLTKNEVWLNARESARSLVKACCVQNTYYITGTGLGQDLNTSVIPTDTQSWTSLAKVNPETDVSSLMYMELMETKSHGFVGTKFALAGKEIQNEATAGAAMALWFAREKSSSFEKKALEYMNSLEKQITEAPNSNGFGIVATPAEVADTGEGLGWKYFNYLHVASSAWTGLALLGKDTKLANPYASLE